MARGSPIIPLRVPPDVLQEWQAALASRNAVSAEPPQTLSEFIRAAVADKLKHLARGRQQRRRHRLRREPAAAVQPAE